MSCFLTNSSLGKKLVMSITGCFLVLFLLFHMSMNVAMLFSYEAYDAICAFLGANWYALVATVILAAGVAVHFIYAFILTINNYRARGEQRYAVTVQEKGVAWASKNMLVLGIIVILGLGLHLVHFWSKMQLVEIMGHHASVVGGLEVGATSGAALMMITFSKWYNVVLYIVWFAALWFHLTHGFWSAIQTLGINNKVWFCRWKAIGNVIVTLIILGFFVVVVAGFFGMGALGQIEVAAPCATPCCVPCC